MEKYRKIGLFVAGLFFASFGAALFSSGNVGMDAFSTFSLGLSGVLSLSFGTACIISGLMLLGVLFILDRKYVKIGGVLYAFGLGSCIDLWFRFFAAVNLSVPVLLRVIIGVLVFSFGIALYILSDVGSGAVEAFSLSIVEKTGRNLGFVRVMVDLAFLLLGILLQAQVGYGTIIGVVAIGPSVNFFLEKMSKRLPWVVVK